MAYGDKFGNGGQSNDEIIKTAENTTLRGVLSRVVYSNSDYGERVGVRFEDAVLVEGVLMEDVDSGYRKVFGWSEFENQLPADYTAEDAPEEYDYRHPMGVNTYRLVAARLVPEEGDPSGDEYEIGDMITYEGGSAKPKGFSRALVHSLALDSDNMILSTEDIYNWLSPEVTARPGLVGRELYYVKYLEPSDRGNPFQMPQIIDAETGETIIKEGVDNFSVGADAPEPAAPTPTTDGGVAAEAAPAPSPVPTSSNSAVDEFVTTMIDLQVDDEAQILAQLESLVDADGHDLTAKAVEAFGGESEVVNAILG